MIREVPERFKLTHLIGHMYILALNGSCNSIKTNCFKVNKGEFHDSGAVLLKDNKVVACFEEERFNRIKHTNKFPVQSISKCISHANIKFSDIDWIAIPVDEQIMDMGLFFYHKEGLLPELHTARNFLCQRMFDDFDTSIEEEKILFFNHHRSHAATAYYPTDFKDALVLTLDGEGDELSGSVSIANKGDIKLIKSLPAEKSLGKLYLTVTEHLGYGLFDEYKVMGLASYGDPKVFKDKFSETYSLLDDGNYDINFDVLKKVLNDVSVKNAELKFSKVHKDIAACLQQMLEIIVLHILAYYRRLTQTNNLCMAGGVALNCSLNKVIADSNLFKKIYVSPVSSDSGLSLGAALLAFHEVKGVRPTKTFESIYLGIKSSEIEIEKDISNWSSLVDFEHLSNPIPQVAQLLTENKVIGWFQDAAEFGPRALGNRSILADPRPFENRNKINRIIKMREGYRPFAPSVVIEELHEFFEVPINCEVQYSYMTFTLNIKKRYQPLLQAVCHVDGTARVQSVSKEENFKFWNLLQEFGKISGVPILLNTSFNNNFEPIVNKPDEAITCFLTSELDYLVLNEFLVKKKSKYLDNVKLSQMNLSIPEYIIPKIIENHGGSKYYLSNTYDSKMVSIPLEVYEELMNIDSIPNQTKTMEKLLSNYRPLLFDLWQKRLISLKPKSLGYAQN